MNHVVLIAGLLLSISSFGGEAVGTENVGRSSSNSGQLAAKPNRVYFEFEGSNPELAFKMVAKREKKVLLTRNCLRAKIDNVPEAEIQTLRDVFKSVSEELGDERAAQIFRGTLRGAGVPG